MLCPSLQFQHIYCQTGSKRLDYIFQSFIKLLRTSQLGMSAEDKHDLDLSTENMKRHINDIQEQYESFIDSNQLYKQRKINEKKLINSIGEYLATTSSLNFLAIEEIIQLKSVVEKNRIAKYMRPT